MSVTPPDINRVLGDILASYGNTLLLSEGAETQILQICLYV